ncbi:competence/damage-inducible CinA N-terminal domain protein, partial [Vibrio parahaemolyticus V-223/04]
LVYTIR